MYSCESADRGMYSCESTDRGMCSYESADQACKVVMPVVTLFLIGLPGYSCFREWCGTQKPQTAIHDLGCGVKPSIVAPFQNGS